GAGSTSPNDRGVDLSGATLNANGGHIVIRGRGFAGTGSDNYGVYIHNDSTVQTSGAGTITIVGEGGTGTNSNQGVRIDGNSANGTTISTVDGALSITGTGGTGVGGGSGGFLRGIRFIAGRVSSVNGAISLTGTSGNDAGNDNDGVHMAAQATVLSTGTGDISITGTVGGPASLVDNDGVTMIGTVRSTGTGAIHITGTSKGSASGQLNTGVYISGTVESTAAGGSGGIEITGTAGPGTGNDKGVFIDGSGGFGIVRAQNSGITILATGGSAATDHGLLVSGASATLATVTGGDIAVTVAGPAAGSRILLGQPVTTAGALSLATTGPIDLPGSISTGGVLALSSGTGQDITLGGSLQATRSGLADNVAAIDIASGRDILLASTTSLTTPASGAIRLTAAGAINLKVNDGGNNGASNSLAAAGNLDLSAGTAISRTDGNAVLLSGKAVSLSAGSSIGSLGGAITASTGDLVLSAA
ncbi:MAG: hypothetical protein JNM97_20120, partial [Rhodoferax sp.]|nr:hypothetical protein [Rhodoferax sp.]